MKDLRLQKGKKVYFASDNHLGAPTSKDSLPREKKFVAWLDSIKDDAGALFLMGDLFDFWFEYKTVVPKGFTRTLGKLAELSDMGIQITYFVGNHDLWMNGYFEEELNIPVYHKPQQYLINGTSFFVGHGDGLGPDDKGFKRMKKVFTNPFAKWLFRWLHPDWGVRLGQHLSVNNKIISGDADAKFLGEDKEWLVLYAKRKLETQHYDHFIFGHRHLPMEIKLNEKSAYTNLGDWINYFTYAVFDGGAFNFRKVGGMIQSKENSEHYHWGQQCSGWHLVKTDSLSVIEELMSPDTSEKKHYHKQAQQFFRILKGIATFELEHETVQVPAGKGIHILPKTRHKIRNDQKVNLEFLVISQPTTRGDRIEVPSE